MGVLWYSVLPGSVDCRPGSVSESILESTASMQRQTGDVSCSCRAWCVYSCEGVSKACSVTGRALLWRGLERK